MTSKLDLLNEVINNTYVVLKPSSVAGVGVFALGTFRRDAATCSVNRIQATIG